MLGLAIRSEKRGDEQKLSEALHRLVAEDPCVRVEHHAALNETVLYGLGELHLRVMLERMTERYGVAVKTSPPTIPYRETISRPAEGHHRHKKQTGGAGQFGEVFLRVEPLERGTGFEFVDEVVGRRDPGPVHPGRREGRAPGDGRRRGRRLPAAGHSRQRLRRQASPGRLEGSRFRRRRVARRLSTAIRKAEPDRARAGGAHGDQPRLRTRSATSPAISRPGARASTARTRCPGGRAEITALVPLAEMQDYQSRLKALTGGEGAYTMELSHYDPVPARRQQELIAAFKPREEAD